MMITCVHLVVGLFLLLSVVAAGLLLLMCNDTYIPSMNRPEPRAERERELLPPKGAYNYLLDQNNNIKTRNNDYCSARIGLIQARHLVGRMVPCDNEGVSGIPTKLDSEQSCWFAASCNIILQAKRFSQELGHIDDSCIYCQHVHDEC